jgi:hypothetical protein
LLSAEQIGGATPASLTAPAAGLFLERVYYEGERVEQTVRPVVNID